MNVIDLEILIPASPEFIWRFIGDLSAIPRWHNEVVSVSFLSTQREGRGTRWRHSTVKGADIVVEVSAWYDTLGYEYRLVDGSTYSDNQGRIRLQEVTDGTLVRWTFQYEPSGMLGTLRNAMRLKRSATNQIQDSLRNLHQLIAQESGGISTHEAKANMQDAPDVHERSHYQPRHPSALHDVEISAVAADDTTLSERFPLPYDLEFGLDAPVAETDTKPNPVVLGADEAAISDAAPALDDTRPIEVEALLAEPPPTELAEPEAIVADRPPPMPAEPPPVRAEPSFVPAEPPPVRAVSSPVRAEPPPVRAEPPPIQAEPPPIQTEPPPVRTEPPPVRAERAFVPAVPPTVGAEPAFVPAEPPPIPAETPPRVPAEPPPIQAEPPPTIPPELPRDSSQLSVFEIFGLQKPSETRARVEGEGAVDDRSESAITPPDAPPPAPVSEAENGSAEARKAEEDAARAKYSSAGSSTISGWRRSARKRRPLIRSHT